MPYIPTDLIAPKGDIEQTMFPLEQGAALELRVGQYLTEGYSKTNIDDAARAWAYSRAYHAVYTRLLSEPAQANLNDVGSRAYSAEQIGRMKNLSTEQMAIYLRLVTPSSVSETTTISSVRPTRFSF